MSNNVLRDRRTMDAVIGTFQADKKAAFTPKLGKVRPIDIISLERRKTDENTVTDLVEALARDGRFLQDIAVRDEGASGYRLIFGANRLEAWKRHFGEQTPIPADIYPADTPDALITIHEIEENLRRKELTAAERPRQTILLAAAVKKLDEEGSLPPISDSGEAETGYLVPRLASTSGGRGNKGVAQRVAEKAGITKRAVRKRLKAASAAIGEKIDLARDTPEELERKAAELEKADMRQRAEPKAERPKRRKPALCAVTEDATPAESQAGEIDSEIEEVWRAFSALSERKQLEIMLRACRLRGWALRMGRARRVPAVDEESAVGLLPETAPPTDVAAAGSQDEQQDDAIDLGTEDLQDTDHASEDIDDASDDAQASGDHASDPDVSVAADDHACDGADDAISETADQELGGAIKCAYCKLPIENGDECQMIYGQLCHTGLCVKHFMPIAIARWASKSPASFAHVS